MQLIGDAARTGRSVPLLGFAQVAASGYFDDGGYPTGKGWDQVSLPSIHDEHAYALEISGDQMRPVYRDGDVSLVSPGTRRLSREFAVDLLSYAKDTLISRGNRYASCGAAQGGA